MRNRRWLLILGIAVSNLGIATVARADDVPKKRGLCSSCLDTAGLWYDCCPRCSIYAETCDCTFDDDCTVIS